MRIVRLTEETKKNILENMLKRSPSQYGSYEAVVQDILTQVKEKKDEAVFAYTKKFASYKQKEGQKLYDVRLDDYAEGFNTDILDDFFGKLREALVPVIQKVSEKKDMISQDCLRKSYDIETQKKLSRLWAILKRTL